MMIMMMIMITIIIMKIIIIIIIIIIAITTIIWVKKSKNYNSVIPLILDEKTCRSDGLPGTLHVVRPD